MIKVMWTISDRDEDIQTKIDAYYEGTTRAEMGMAEIITGAVKTVMDDIDNPERDPVLVIDRAELLVNGKNYLASADAETPDIFWK